MTESHKFKVSLLNETSYNENKALTYIIVALMVNLTTPSSLENNQSSSWNNVYVAFYGSSGKLEF